MKSLIERAKIAFEWWQTTRLARMLARYKVGRGNQLAGGIAYAALFSIFAALTISFSTFMRVLRGNREFYDAVLEALDQTLPGVVDTGDGSGLISPEDLIDSPGVGIAGIISAVVLLFSALAVMKALTASIRAMFDVTTTGGQGIKSILRDFLAFILLAVSILLTAAMAIIASLAGEWIADLLGLNGDSSQGLIRMIAIVGAFVVDVGIWAGLIRLVGGLRPLPKDLWIGAGIGAVATGALRILGTSVIGGAADNPMLASVAAIITLLLWVNIAARILLYVCAWIANPPSDTLREEADQVRWRQRPNYVTLSAPHTLEWDRRDSGGSWEESATTADSDS